VLRAKGIKGAGFVGFIVKILPAPCVEFRRTWNVWYWHVPNKVGT